MATNHQESGDERKNQHPLAIGSGMTQSRLGRANRPVNENGRGGWEMVPAGAARLGSQTGVGNVVKSR
jgi:hypothetical protein